MSEAHITKLFLTAFKSFTDEVLPLSDLTILTGLNSSGKSNALDGLDVLSRLASGSDLADVLDGKGRGLGPVRGGSVGCPPHGTHTFTLGCDVQVDEDSYHYEVAVQVTPDLRIESEKLTGPARAQKSATFIERDLVTAAGDSTVSGLEVRIHNGARGVNPSRILRDNRSVLPQAAPLVPGKTNADRDVLRAIDAVTGALRAVFEFNPIPSTMRGYVPRRDDALKRDGSNLAAALDNLKRTQPERARNVMEAISQIAANEVTDLRIETSTLDDVTFSLVERDSERTPAREMSDGLLRFAAVATALQSTAGDLDVDTEDDLHALAPGSDPVTGRVRVVLEEIENGLHPSQAQVALRMIKDAVDSSGLEVTVTTHSPALLNALTGELNDKVIVCYRDDDGRSRLSRLMDLPSYSTAMAHGSIGDLVSRAELVSPVAREPVDVDGFLAAIGG